MPDRDMLPSKNDHSTFFFTYAHLTTIFNHTLKKIVVTSGMEVGPQTAVLVVLPSENERPAPPPYISLAFEKPPLAQP